MRVPGLRKLQRWGGRYGRFLTSSALVLMYHRVHEADSDPWSLNVSESHFDEHMQVLRERRSVINLTDLHSAMRVGQVPKGAIAVTFDDGYADNLLTALPILSRHDIPATVFVTAGQSAHRREFWWDELERLVIQSTTLPSRLDIRTGEHVHSWEIPDALGARSTTGGDDHYRSARSAGDRASQCSIPTSRLDLYFQIWAVLQCQVQSVQDEVLDYLTHCCGEDSAPADANRVLSREELRVLSDSRLIDIGAHTSTHAQLTAHSVAVQQQELSESKRWLEDVCDRTVAGLAYPYGSHDSQTRRVARESGYDFACTTLDAASWRYTDSLQIPRMTVLDWSGEEFERQLDCRLTRPW